MNLTQSQKTAVFTAVAISAVVTIALIYASNNVDFVEDKIG